MNQTNQIIYTFEFEFKRTLDREHRCVQRCDDMIQEPQSSMQVLCKSQEELWRGKDGKCKPSIYFIACRVRIGGGSSRQCQQKRNE